MLTFKSFLKSNIVEKVNEEIMIYGFSEEEFFTLSEEHVPPSIHNVPSEVLDEPKTPREVAVHKLHFMPNPRDLKPPKKENVWQKMRQGAHEYFSADPKEQKKLRDEANEIRPQDLFTDEASNPKLAKNGKKVPEYKTKGLFLAPSTMSGTDVCPAATKECKAACLGPHSGRGVMEPVKKSRLDRTHFMLNSPKHFYAKLDAEIEAAKKAAHKRSQKVAVRLNGTSDIPHEHIAPQLFKKHHDAQFYDYTKLAGRPKHKGMPENYHLTVSSTGLNHAGSNWKQVRDHLDRGGVASMVFQTKTARMAGQHGVAGQLPTHVHDEETGKIYKVIDGDEHDHRHLDHALTGTEEGQGLIAGLRLKGMSDKPEKAGKFAVAPNDDGSVTAKRGQN